MALPKVVGEFRAVADPELRFSESGTAVAKVRVVADKKKKQGDEWVDDKVCWLRVTAFKRMAENIAESVVKGTRIYVEGQLSTEEWEDREGNKRQSYEVIADQVALSLAWDTYEKIERERKSSGGGSSRSRAAEDPWGSPSGDEPPF